jgi:hypothetical protein
MLPLTAAQGGCAGWIFVRVVPSLTGKKNKYA